MVFLFIAFAAYFLKNKRKQWFELTIMASMIIKYSIYALFEIDFIETRIMESNISSIMFW